MDCIVNQNDNLDLDMIQTYFKKESFINNPEAFNELLEEKFNTEDIEMKYDTGNLNEEFDIKDEFSDDSDDDIENDLQIKTRAKKATTDKTIDWPKDDLDTLIKKIELALPDKDTLAYNTRAEKLNWDDIRFNEYSSEACKTTWFLIQKRLRHFRFLSEVLQDAKEWVSKPWTDYYRRKKTRNLPDMPRRPLSVYMLFYLQMKDDILAKNPGTDMCEVTKKISEIYKNLPPEERIRYTNMALKEKQDYEAKLKEFYCAHPEIVREVEKPTKSNKSTKSNKPSTPFYLFYKDQIKDPGVDNNTFKEECKKQWKILPDKKKLAWINIALENEAKYQDEVKAYINDNPDFTPPVLKPILTKEEKSLKERLAGKPVKPANSAYGVFAAMMLQSAEIKKIPPKERMKAVADEWKASSKEEKIPFQERVVELAKQYKEDLAAYLDSLPEYERREVEAQNLPKRKSKNVEKTESVPEKKKKLKEPSKETNEKINVETVIKTEIKIEPPQPSIREVEAQNLPKRKTKNVEKTESVPEKKKKSKGPSKEADEKINIETVIKAEPPQPPISGLSLFTCYYKGPLSKKTAWKGLPEEEREEYESRVKKMKQKYIVEYEKFLKSLSREQLEAFSESQRKGTTDENDEEDSSDSEDSSSENE